jgi:hypothetical protein
MADNGPNKKIRAKDIEMETTDISEIIAKTVSKTFEQLAPYLGSGDSKQKGTLREESQNVRSRIIKEINNDFAHVMNANKRFLQGLANIPRKDLVTVRIPRVYAKQFGSVLPMGLNGSVIGIPIDNKPHLIPKVFKPFLENTLNYEDEKISFMERSGNVDMAEIPEGSLRSI